MHQLAVKLAMFEKCKCPEDRQIVRAYAGVVIDQMRAGYLETQCQDCGQAFRYNLGDCFTLKYRKRIAVH